jgi:hypothetical protein
MKKIDPKCLDKRQQMFGFTNQGQLIPCCWLDTKDTRKDPKYQKLLEVSKLDDYDSIEEILLNNEWIEFINDLKNDKGFPMCYEVCKKRETPQHMRRLFPLESIKREH